MAGRYPKPDGQKVHRGKPAFDWVDLPVKREGPTPGLPAWRRWDAETRKWWTQLWEKPQAVMWDSTGSTLWALACLYDDLIKGDLESAKVSSEMRAHEDRHGLNPKALLQLRWRFSDLPEAEDEAPASEARARRERLKVVG